MNFGDKIIALYDTLTDLGKKSNISVKYRVLETPNFQTKVPVLFGNFPWYYRLITHGSGIFLSKENSFFLSVAPNWKMGENDFLENKYIIVRPEININNIADFVEFVKSLRENTQTPLLIKQVSEEVYDILLQNGFRQYTESENWDESSKYDDQTFPEVILRTSEYVSNNYARGSIKEKVNAGEFFIEKCDLSDKENQELAKEYIFHIFYDWLKHFRKRHPDAINKNFVQWNLETFDAMISDETLIVLFVKNKAGKPIGVFSLTETLPHCQFDIVFSFVSEFEGNFQRVAYDMLISWMHEKHQCAYLNLGGSELQSLFEFKKSLGNHIELKTYHLIYE